MAFIFTFITIRSAKLLLVLVLHCYQAKEASAQTVNKMVYGKDWVVFRDDKGKPHYVNLTIPVGFKLLARMDSRFLRGNPTYWLYTRETVHNPEEIKTPIQKNTIYKEKEPLVIIVHGWLCNRDSESTQLIKNAILTRTKRNDNIIIMDWSSMQIRHYVEDAAITKIIAEKLKDFVKSLSNLYHIPGSRIHFIGHSLGAHVVGLAGDKLKENQIIISRVTGLDPARPFFEFLPIFPGITKDSAAFVDIIHTCTGILGIINAVGHVDFYPGGGVFQPAVCPLSIFPGSCEHASAFRYFQRSFTKKFPARKCDGYLKYEMRFCDNNELQYMGEDCNSTARGSFFLDVDTLT